MERQHGSLSQLSSVGFLKRGITASLQANDAPVPVFARSVMSGSRVPVETNATRSPVRRSMFFSQIMLSQRQAVAFSSAEKPPEDLSVILKKAAKRAMGGGIPGMVAMVIQVFALMWMRTTINYQYRHGGTMLGTMQTLYREGGIPRFYRGLVPALVQGPLSRFGDTAANAGMLALLESWDSTKNLLIWVKTLGASGAAAGFRIFLMPVDALKTTLQVEGAHGMAVLAGRVRNGGPGVLWHGAIAASGATFVGHYPWFVTRNYMEDLLPKFDDLPRKLLRAAVIGFVASAVSDTCSNSIRVIKTTKQTSRDPISYPKALQMVLAKDGITGLLFRGLGTKILSNGMQGLLFNVLWRMGMDYWDKMEKAKEGK